MEFWNSNCIDKDEEVIGFADGPTKNEQSECNWQMYVNKQRNKFITEQYRDLATEFYSMFGSDAFVGDDMLVHNCNRSFMHDE